MVIAPAAPMPAASVGVNHPRMSPPITRQNRISISIVPESDLIFSLTVVLGAGEPIAGFMKHIKRIQTVNREERTIPGRIPAIKSLPMESSVCIPYTIRTMLGGMRIPRVPPAATVPVANALSYLNFFISGRATVPMVAAVGAFGASV